MDSCDEMRGSVQVEFEEGDPGLMCGRGVDCLYRYVERNGVQCCTV